MKGSGDTEYNGFKPKNYQVEMYELGKEKNIIVKLNTGSGKTFIAVMLIKHYLHTTNKPIEQDGKRIFFLVKNVNLVFQQANAIKQHIALEDTDDTSVGKYHGQIKPGEWVDFWDKETWRKVFNQHRVIVITAGVFKDILNHAKFNLQHASLVIFDECHHTAKEDDYSQICKHLNAYRGDITYGPRILGLTACVVNGNIKCSDIQYSVDQLEYTMNSRLVTSRSSVGRVNNTDTQEIVYPYDTTELSPLYWEIASLLDKAKEETAQYMPKKKKSERSSAPSSSAMTLLDLEENIFDKIKKSISDSKSVLDELGPWCCHKVIDNYLRDLENSVDRLFDNKSRTALNITLNALKRIQTVYLGNSARQKTPDISRKCKVLLEILRQYDKEFVNSFQSSSKMTGDNSSHNGEFLGLVFVTERQVAYGLCELLSYFSKHCPEFGFLNVDYITGHGASSRQTKEVHMTVAQQSKALADFRQGSVNLLIATRVVEEGMDVQKCNLVIKMDPPIEFRSYVQSKGRARAANSFYIILTPSNKTNECQYALHNYQNIDKELNRVIKDRCVDQDDSSLVLSSSSSLDDKEVYMPRGPDGPRITLNSSMSILNRYLSRLRSDSIMPLRIRLTAEYRDRPEDSLSNIRFVISLPMPCPIREVVGRYSRNKDEAKKFAALKACKLLHLRGELGEDLLPMRNIPLAMDDDFDNEWDMYETNTGTKKKQRSYELPIADILSHKEQQPISFLDSGSSYYLYKITPDTPFEELMNLVEPNFTYVNHSISFLFSKKLCKEERVAKFPLYMEGGCAYVSVSFSKVITLTWDEPEQLKACHRTLVQLFLHSHRHYGEDLIFNPSNSSMPWTMVLTKEKPNGEIFIDWDLTLDIACPNLCAPEEEPITKFPFESLHSIPTDKWQGKVTFTHHNPKEKGYFLINTVTEMSTSSTMPGSLLTFKEHYHKKYNKLVNRNDKIIDCIRLPTPRDLLCYSAARNKNTSGKIRRIQETKTYFIPEYCCWMPLPASLWIKLTVTPFIVYRLNQMLVGEQLFRTIHQEMEFSEVQLDFPLFLNPDECSTKVDDPHAQLVRVLGGDPAALSPSRPSQSAHYHYPHHAKPQSPSPSQRIVSITNIITAITLMNCKDLTNLEKVEIIGDSYLKFIVSVYLHVYCKPEFNEGHLTNRRRAVISNKNLYRLARSRKLDRYIHSRYFLPREYFLPPGCSKKLAEGETSSNYIHSAIGDKSLADCVEALIGCFLWYSGLDMTLRLLKWLDVKLIPDPSARREDLPEQTFDDIFHLPPPPPALIHHSMSRKETDQRLDRLCCQLDVLEKKILHYEFKDRALLLQAVTHPSWVDNKITHCYQRLEFLGDAVLDYLVTMQICVENPDMTPGKITDLRSALVNNYLFAVVTVKFEIHKFLRHSDPIMFKVIDEFAEKMKLNNYNFYFDEVSYSKENNEAKLTIKVLGDLIESLTGAVYVDSGYNLQLTRKIFFRLLEEPLKQFKANIPINLLRQFHEKYPGVKFIDAEELPTSNLIRLKAQHNGETIGCETASSKKMCRLLIASKLINPSRTEVA